MKVRAIFFDLDDTLVEDTLALEQCAEAAVREVAPGIRADPRALAVAYVESAIDFWESLEPGAARPRSGDIRPSMWRAALARHGIEDASLAGKIAERYDVLRLERAELLPEAVPVLAALHGRYKLAIITNGFAETHEKKIARLELGRFFDHVILAGEMHLVKPDPAIFVHAMALAGMHAAGMRAIWIQMRGETVPPGARSPDAVITGIGDLPKALTRLEASTEGLPGASI